MEHAEAVLAEEEARDQESIKADDDGQMADEDKSSLEATSAPISVKLDKPISIQPSKPLSITKPTNPLKPSNPLAPKKSDNPFKSAMKKKAKMEESAPVNEHGKRPLPKAVEIMNEEIRRKKARDERDRYRDHHRDKDRPRDVYMDRR